MGIDFALSFTLIEHKNSCETLGIYAGLLKAHLGAIMTFGNIQQKAGGKVTLLLWSTMTAADEQRKNWLRNRKQGEECLYKVCDYL